MYIQLCACARICNLIYNEEASIRVWLYLGLYAYGESVTMGNSQIPVDTICKQEWDGYRQEMGGLDLKEGWGLILDDSRSINITHTTSNFLARFSDIMENLFLGCKEVVSSNVHRELVDVTVKRMETLIQFDHQNHTEREFSKSVRLFRATDDPSYSRKTEMILVMIVRITVAATTSRNPEARIQATTTQREQNQAHIETAVKLQIRSVKEEQSEIMMYNDVPNNNAC